MINAPSLQLDLVNGNNTTLHTYIETTHYIEDLEKIVVESSRQTISSTEYGIKQKSTIHTAAPAD